MARTDTLPSPKVMFRALVDRDSNFEGIFFAGVKTTGIFCRPTCPARKPKAENIEYFCSPQEALAAGYRPCARCRPMIHQKEATPLVRQLCDAIEKSPNQKIMDADLRAMGIDPSTARRQFQKYFGMTFQAYSRLRRMGEARQIIRNGDTVIGAQIDTGFESASGFFDAFKQVFGTPPSQAEKVNCLFARWIDTPLGAMLALGNDDGISMLDFVDRPGLEKDITRRRTELSCAVTPGTNTHLDKLASEVKDYFAGLSLQFSVPLIPIGTPFELSVWKALREIPAGQTRSYADLARRIGRPGSSRAVGRANGRNGIAIVIPCHRVIRSDGTLCGYGGGVWRKKWLLEHERRVTANGSNLLAPYESPSVSQGR